MFRHAIALALLAASVLPAAAQFGPTAAERAACKDDQAKFCPDAKPGGGRILACLAEHKPDLTDACRKVLAAHGK